MGYQIGNLGPGRQSGDHRAKAIEKYPDTGVEPVAYGLRIHCFTFFALYNTLATHSQKHHMAYLLVRKAIRVLNLQSLQIEHDFVQL